MRARVDATDGYSKPVLPGAHRRERSDPIAIGGQAVLAQMGSNRRLVDAQERIAGAFTGQRTRQARQALGPERIDLDQAAVALGILGFRGEGESPVGLCVFVAATDTGGARQGG